MELETERLLIREFKQTDLDSIHEYASDTEVVKYMPFGPNTIEDSKNFLDRASSRQQEETRTDYELAVTLKDSNKLIGGCRINKVSEIQAHIGYIFNKKYWGYGYATETARALVDYGFTELEMHRIYASCDPDNIASRRVLEKAGLVLEGRLREDMVVHGKFRDSLILGLLKHEWEEN
jgi:RimJ/RimL family protein N-acetyltransferase